MARGLDFEASYRWSVADIIDGWAGDMYLHGTATKYIKNYTDNGISEPTDSAGENSGNGPPNWRYQATLSYTLDAFRASLTARGLSDGVYSNSYIECTTGCPLSTIDHRTINDNHVEGQFWFDFATSYKFEVGDSELEAFLNIRNLLNADPKIVAPLATGSAFNRGMYDVLGRVFRTGVRFKM